MKDYHNIKFWPSISILTKNKRLCTRWGHCFSELGPLVLNILPNCLIYVVEDEEDIMIPGYITRYS